MAAGSCGEGLRGGGGCEGGAVEGLWGAAGRGCGGARGGARERERSSARLGAACPAWTGAPWGAARPKNPRDSRRPRAEASRSSVPRRRVSPRRPPRPSHRWLRGPERLTLAAGGGRPPLAALGTPRPAGTGGAPAPGPPLWDLAPLALGHPAPAHPGRRRRRSLLPAPCGPLSLVRADATQSAHPRGLSWSGVSSGAPQHPCPASRACAAPLPSRVLGVSQSPPLGHPSLAL